MEKMSVREVMERVVNTPNPWTDVWSSYDVSYATSRQTHNLFNPDDFCFQCSELSSLCIRHSLPHIPEHLSLARQDLPATIPLQPGNRNAARSPQRQEMQSSSGACATAAASLPEDTYTEHESSGMTALATLDPLEAMPGLMVAANQPLSDGRTSLSEFERLQGTDLSRSTEIDDAGTADGEAARTLNDLAKWPANLPNGNQSHSLDLLALQDAAKQANGASESADQMENAILTNAPFPLEESQQELDDIETDPQNAKAYAKLVFADGDLFVTTHDVMLGRNMERFEQMRRRKKQEKRAREELDTYRKEPSQPSQPGDEDQQGDPSNSSQSLEGRPAPPSNFSEHGGPVWYPPHSDGEAETARSKPKRRVSHFSKSSSTTSVAPANLHPSTMSDLSNSFNEPEVRTFAFIPIHTRAPEDISKISKEHLMFSFNFRDAQWELKVLGNRAFVNDELFEKGTVVPLRHNDEIIIASVQMVFKLPDNFRQSPGLSRGTFSNHSDEEEISDADSSADERAISTSPVRRLSNALDIASSESEDEESERLRVEERAARKKPNLKRQAESKKTTLKYAKSNTKKSLKKFDVRKPGRKQSMDEQSPKATKKLEKGKKPKAVEAEVDKDVNREEASPPSAPFIKPGSALEGIPLEELPEKRKGPGRPPKEGNVSKRDTALANKKRKEYEKRGEEPPAFKDLVTMVRRENKLKEMQARMVANGQLEPGVDVVQSIEPEASTDAMERPDRTTDVTSATPAEPSARRSPPRPKRTVRALSPVKPLEECTEEDLKKPDRTYVHILDEVLRNHPGEGADLPDIYERMQKRHPYFKYQCKTLGWQSSVRHNLQQSPRFKDVGKAGKGKLWAIDWDSPLEKEKKRKVTPPKQTMHNGQFVPGQMPHAQYGQAQYGNPYGPPGLGPHGTYYSPYAQPGQFAGQHMQPSSYSASQQSLSGHHQADGSGSQLMSRLVDELVRFHGRHMAQFPPNTPEHDRQQKLLQAITEHFSDFFHGKDANDNVREQIVSSDDMKLYEKLEKLFRTYRPDLVVPSPLVDAAEAAAPQNHDVTIVPQSAPAAGAIGEDSAHTSPDDPLLGASAADNGNEGARAPALADVKAPQSAIELAIESSQRPNSKRAAEEDDHESDPKRQKHSDT